VFSLINPARAREPFRAKGPPESEPGGPGWISHYNEAEKIDTVRRTMLLLYRTPLREGRIRSESDNETSRCTSIGPLTRLKGSLRARHGAPFELAALFRPRTDFAATITLSLSLSRAREHRGCDFGFSARSISDPARTCALRSAESQFSVRVLVSAPRAPTAICFREPDETIITIIRFFEISASRYRAASRLRQRRHDDAGRSSSLSSPTRVSPPLPSSGTLRGTPARDGGRFKRRIAPISARETTARSAPVQVADERTSSRASGTRISIRIPIQFPAVLPSPSPPPCSVTA